MGLNFQVKKLENSLVFLVVLVAIAVVVSDFVLVVVVSSVVQVSLDLHYIFFLLQITGNSSLLFRNSLYMQSSRKNLDCGVRVYTNNKVSNTMGRNYT